jgi:hypothetical protein
VLFQHDLLQTGAGSTASGMPASDLTTGEDGYSRGAARTSTRMYARIWTLAAWEVVGLARGAAGLGQQGIDIG